MTYLRKNTPMYKVHYVDPGISAWSPCGHERNHTTNLIGFVTCKRCLDLLAKGVKPWGRIEQ